MFPKLYIKNNKKSYLKPIKKVIRFYKNHTIFTNIYIYRYYMTIKPFKIYYNNIMLDLDYFYNINCLNNINPELDFIIK